MPLFEKRGRKQAFLLRGRGREKPSALRLGPRVLIAVRSLYEETIASVDAVHLAHAERAGSPHGHSSTRPRWMPAVLSGAGTTATTRSPVLKPRTCFHRI